MPSPISRLLGELVAIPSVNPMGREEPRPEFFEYRLTDYLEQFFQGLDVSYHRQPVAPHRDNIYGIWHHDDSRPTLLWEAHQDTVPIDHMTIDPFVPTVEGDRLFGRGSCDVKGGMSSMMTAFERLVRAKPPGAANVILAFTVDEEHNFEGIQRFREAGVRADAAVVAEPTCLKIVHAHKGVVRWHVHTRGQACHSAMPEQGSNAIYHMGKVLSAIEEYAEHLRQTRVDPLLGPATLSVGRIEGGASVNTVPDFCRIEIDRRVIPGEDPGAVAAEMTSYVRWRTPVEVIWEQPWMANGALSSRGSEELVQRLGQAVSATIGSYEQCAVPYCTNAPMLKDMGIPAVVFGPGDIAQAHRADEWICLDQVDQAAEILYRLAHWD